MAPLRRPARNRRPRRGARIGSVGRNSWRGCSSTLSTAGHPAEVTADPVRITHPFHPRCGQSLDVIVCRFQWGEERVFYRDPHGHRASLPACWTSLAPPDPYLTVAASRSRFRLQDLLDLAALLEEVHP